MTQPETQTPTDSKEEAESWTCQFCGCEIAVRHGGDPDRWSPGATFTCRCGTRMDMAGAVPAAGTTAVGHTANA